MPRTPRILTADRQRRIKHALRQYRCFVKIGGKWKRIKAVPYYANRISGMKVARVAKHRMTFL